MTKLPKFTVEYNEKKEKWVLENDKTGKTIKQTDTKDQMTAGGFLKSVLGPAGGSVKIQKINGRIEEERTFPRKLDPSESKG